MEDLTKHQLVLLTLLVSFVTSIATGIITYTLLQEAPVAVTQTINRVVERTIETVDPTPGEGKEIVREIQVVKEEELVLQSIDKNARSIVRIKTLGFDGNETVVGLGIVVEDGIIVMDARSHSAPANYTILFPDNKAYGVAKTYDVDGLIFMKVGKPANEKYTYYPAILGSAEALKLGQTVIAVSGKTNNVVSVGRVSEITPIKIITDMRYSKSQLGSPLLNLNGEIVGMEVALSEGESLLSYFPVSKVKNTMKAAIAELNKP